MLNDIDCPYCGKSQDIDHDDGYGYGEDEKYQQTCCGCNKTFTFMTSTTFSYEPFKADCLNGGDHDWLLTKTHPRCFTKWYCTMCDEEKELTTEDMIEHGIQTKHEYFKEL